MQWARLLGEITVRSDMQEPGPQDDLLLKTRDLYVNQDLIRTDAEVEMRLGPHWGRGKHSGNPARSHRTWTRPRLRVLTSAGSIRWK